MRRKERSTINGLILCCSGNNEGNTFEILFGCFEKSGVLAVQMLGFIRKGLFLLSLVFSTLTKEKISLRISRYESVRMRSRSSYESKHVRMRLTMHSML